MQADPRRKVQSKASKDDATGRVIVLRIEDLLAGLPKAEAKQQMQFINNTVLRWNSEVCVAVLCVVGLCSQTH